ncbi:alanine dehydrogenase [Legionella sp. W05-934-2]|jgi:NAD/NADP transhydrogenase alpha subunit|uniref:alanine dehydrogenase n=1 Tax=Legionella sp. W05-934-2 TaxID=1198649 RepID=UPI0034635E73
MKTFTILLTAESIPGEMRVGLIPEDVKQLIAKGHRVYVEANAGVGSGYADEAYRQCGAQIRPNQNDYHQLFEGIDIVCRAKRATREREKQESQAFRPGMILIGALDPFNHEGHIEEYHQAQIVAYSIDQLSLPPDHPMNILAQMSAIAGEIAVLDALEKTTIPAPQTLLVIGTGVAGNAAINQGLKQNLTVIVGSSTQAAINALQGNPQIQTFYIDRQQPLTVIQAQVKTYAEKADIVIASARSSGQKAPILFPLSTLASMKPGACIVDLSLSEGGNVEGSHHDKTVTLGNQILVTNTSGYPKVMPEIASPKWSLATRLFIEALSDPSQQSLVESVIIRE